jgi:hypothetical protein
MIRKVSNTGNWYQRGGIVAVTKPDRGVQTLEGGIWKVLETRPGEVPCCTQSLMRGSGGSSEPNAIEMWTVNRHKNLGIGLEAIVTC